MVVVGLVVGTKVNNDGDGPHSVICHASSYRGSVDKKI